MSSGVLRAGLIGLGMMGRHHARVLRALDGVELVAVADPDGDPHKVASGVYYPIPNHRLPSFGLTLDLPETERAAREVLSLPVHPSLSQGDLERVVEAVNALAGAGA